MEYDTSPNTSENLFTEKLVSLANAAKLLPKRRGNRDVNVSTVYRWTTAGLQGVRLESVQVGGTRCTTSEALARFFAKLARNGAEPFAKSGEAVQQTNNGLERALNRWKV